MSLSPAQVVPARSWSTTSPTGAGSANWSCHGRWCLVTLSGELTWRTSRRLHASFRRVVEEGGRELSVDLRSVAEVDPAGVAVLLVYARLLPTLGGTLDVSGASGPCQALLQRMQLSHLLDQRAAEPPAALPAAARDGADSLDNHLTHVPRLRRNGPSPRRAAALEGAS